MNLALFDFDGTVTFKDSFVPFLYLSVDRKRLTMGRIVLLPLIVAYKLRLISPSKMRASLAAYGFRGRRESEVRETGMRFAREVLPQMVRPKAIDMIERHKAHGDVVVVVSAALDVYLEEWCRRAGVEVVCTTLEVKNGILTGRYLGGDCSGAEKVRRVRQRYDLMHFDEIYAYGDTTEDVDLLRLATKKFFRWQEIVSGSEGDQIGDRVDVDPAR